MDGTDFLRPADRCDRCGAQAFYLARQRSAPDRVLLFCRHHGLSALDALTLQGFEITDETWKLAPASAANE